MEIKCIIVEDEPLAAERIRSYVQRLPYLRLVAGFDNGMDALVYVKSYPVDLIFLDINMDGFSGIEFLEAAQTSTHVIITTAYDEYALKGFELRVTDYLLKPFTLQRFIQAVERVQQAHNLTAPASAKAIFIKTAYRLEKVLLEDILYIEGMRDYRRIHTAKRKIMTLQTFGELEQQLPESVICRVHKSFMVALDKIESIYRAGVRVQDVTIPVSDTYRKALLERFSAAS